MSFLSQNLGGGVPETAADRSEDLVVILHVSGDAKVDENYVGVFSFAAVEDVFGFDIAMDNVVVMEVLNGGKNGADGSTCV